MVGFCGYTHLGGIRDFSRIKEIEEYYSTVVWDTKYNTTVDRIERINRIEKLFDKMKYDIE